MSLKKLKANFDLPVKVWILALIGLVVALSRWTAGGGAGDMGERLDRALKPRTLESGQPNRLVELLDAERESP